MKFESINRLETFFSNPFLKEYIQGTKLDSFYQDKPSLENIKQRIAYRKNFSSDIRKELVTQIGLQYKKSKIELQAESKVAANITLLAKDTTFTITTGQQIHLALGPLYVMYKIWNAIAVCSEAKEANPEYDFVPVFWMATEDHDLEEIQDIHLFGKKFTWQTSQTGAVGRMTCDGILDVFTEIRDSVSLTADLSQFIECCEQAYQLPTIADASRYIVHQYFGEHGVVVLDADNAELKSAFASVMNAELIGSNHSSLKNTSERLSALGFDPQIHIRDVNLFYLTDQQRIRISRSKTDRKASLIEVGDIPSPLDPYTISPNVALRPLYQETILPNLVYVGGGSEVKYWAQLQGLFSQHQMEMPLVMIRSNVVIVQEKRWRKTELPVATDLFKESSELIQVIEQDAAELDKGLQNAILKVRTSIEEFKSKFNQAFPHNNIEKKIGKMHTVLEELNQIKTGLIVSSNSQNPAVNTLLKLKSTAFSASMPQERTVGCITHVSLMMNYIQDSYSHFGLRNSHFVHVLVE